MRIPIPFLYVCHGLKTVFQWVYILVWQFNSSESKVTEMLGCWSGWSSCLLFCGRKWTFSFPFVWFSIRWWLLLLFSLLLSVFGALVFKPNLQERKRIFKFFQWIFYICFFISVSDNVFIHNTEDSPCGSLIRLTSAACIAQGLMGALLIGFLFNDPFNWNRKFHRNKIYFN